VKAYRLVALAVAGVSMLALSGCSQSGNVAARVGDETVSTSDVDFLTRIQCDTLNKAAKDPAQAGSVQAASTAQVRTGMMNTLLEAEIDRQLAASQHLDYDKATLRSVMSQFESVVQQAPKADQDRFRELVESVYRGQLQVWTEAQAELARQGVQSPDQQQVAEAVSALQAKFRKTVDISVNPVYGANAAGTVGAADPSLSIPVSSFAKQARSSTPDPTWVSKLPADQRCG